LPGTIVFKNPRGIPFPQRWNTSIRVAIMGNLTAATTPAVYFARGNAANTPFLGGGWPGVLTSSITSLNPAGFKNLCSNVGPYNNYRVFGSKIRVRFVASAATDLITYTVTPGNTGSAPSGVPDALAEPRTKSTRTQGGASLTEIKHSMLTSTFLGLGPLSVRDDFTGVLTGAYNSQPSAQFYWYVGWSTSNGGTLGAAMSYEVEIIYDLEFFNLNAGALLDD
jgi:hypothetical protein